MARRYVGGLVALVILATGVFFAAPEASAQRRYRGGRIGRVSGYRGYYGGGYGYGYPRYGYRYRRRGGGSTLGKALIGAALGYGAYRLYRATEGRRRYDDDDDDC